MPRDVFCDDIQIGENLVIRVTHNTQSKLSKVGRSGFVILNAAIVTATVNLDYEICRGAVEINDV